MDIQTMRRIGDQAIPEDGYIGNFAVRPMSARYGQPHEGHAHWIDHLTLILKGPVAIEWRDPETGKSGVIEVKSAPWFVSIPKERWHRFVPLSEVGAEWVCIFAVSHGDEAGVSRNDFNFERMTHG